MNLIMLIVGIVLIVAAVIAVAVSIARTPENLRGFYGAMFVAIAVVGFLGGAALIVVSFLM